MKKANALGSKESASSDSGSQHHWSGAHAAGNPRLRELIVDLRRPEFDNLKTNSSTAGSLKMLFMPPRHQPSILAYMDEAPSSGRNKPAAKKGEDALVTEYLNLNGDQQEAVKKVLSARDYVLLLGMPGTG